MAEALVVAGAVANIVQLVEFGSKALLRLNEFLASPGRVPESFRQLQTDLRLLLHTLKYTQTAIETGFVLNTTREALCPVIDGCRKQMEILDAILTKTTPAPGDSWRKRGVKALLSLQQDGKVKGIRDELYRSIQALTYYHAASLSKAWPARGTSDMRNEDVACHIPYGESIAPPTGHNIVSTVLSLVQQTQHAFLSRDHVLQRQFAQIYGELGQQSALLRELKVSIDEITGNNDEADKIGSTSTDIFFDCASRFSLDQSRDSIDELSTSFTGSPAYSLERKPSFYPELFVTGGLFSNPLFTIAMKQSYRQDVSIIQQVSATDNDDDSCKLLPDAVGTELIKSLPRIRLFNSVTSFSLTFTEFEDGKIALDEAQPICDKILESDVHVVSQMTSSCFAVVLRREAYIERKVPFASAGREGENGFRDFISDLKLLNSLRNCPGVSQLRGVVLDDTHRHLKGYLYESPMIFRFSHVFYIANSRSDMIPWSVTELWCKQIARAVANVHERDLIIGVLSRSNIGLRADGSAVLIGLQASKKRLLDGIGEMPPELRRAQQQSFDDTTDVFQLGLMLWLLAEHKGNIRGSTCSRYACTSIPHYQCTADHANPVELPPCCGSVPTYLSKIIRWCRSSSPDARPTARHVAEILSSRSCIQACPPDILELLKSYLGDATCNVSVHCSECGSWAHHLHYHCYICNLGNFDLCPGCVARRIHCYALEHKLVNRMRKNGRYFNVPDDTS